LVEARLPDFKVQHRSGKNTVIAASLRKLGDKNARITGIL